MNFKDKQKLVHKRLKHLRDNATKAELRAVEILKKRNIKHIFQKCFIKGEAFCIVDIYIPKRKICIEIDGEYHENTKGYDNWKDNYLESRGFTVKRIKNEDVEDICLLL